MIFVVSNQLGPLNQSIIYIYTWCQDSFLKKACQLDIAKTSSLGSLKILASRLTFKSFRQRLVEF